MKGNFIEVTEFRAIASDARQWMLMKRTKKLDSETGKPVGGYTEWKSYSYYSGTLGEAAAALEEELVKLAGANTFPELRRTAQQIHDLIEETRNRWEVP